MTRSCGQHDRNPETHPSSLDALISELHMPNPIDDWQSLLFFEADNIRAKPFEIEESRILALPRRVGKKRYLTELVATGQKKGVIDGLEQ